MQSGQLVDLGNVRLVGMDADELSSWFKVRIDDQRRVWMLPEAIINESVKAFSVDPVSPTGYGTLGPPSGKYIAPADSLDCIETIRGWGDCGLRSVVLTGPMFKQFDIGIAKRVSVWSQANVEFRIDVLNAFNNVNFVPVSGMVAGDGGGQYRQPGERRQPGRLRRDDADRRQPGPRGPAAGAASLVGHRLTPIRRRLPGA